MSDLNPLAAVSAPLPWHGSVWKQFQQRLADDRFAPALLLSGAPAIGKNRLALALARLLLCHRPQAGHNCGSCSGCELSAAGSHGDFRWLEPTGDSRVIKIDQVREAVAFANRTAGFGQRKVLVISPADQMNTSAANALLKCLEEPSASTFIILVCQRLHGLPATIRSRCQLLQLALPDPAASLAWLDQLTHDSGTSAQLLALAQGRPLAAERLYEESGTEALLARRAGLLALVRGKLSVSETTALLAEMDLAAVLLLLATFAETALKSLGREQLSTSAAQQTFVLLDTLGNSRAAIAAGANPNRQLLLESLLIQVKKALGTIPLGDNMLGLTGGAG